MPRPPIDLDGKIREMLGHVDPLPPEAETPLAHYIRSSTDSWNLLRYVERNFDQLSLYQAVAGRHLGRLHGMLLVNLIENFERFLKEVAAACVDRLAPFVADDRFNVFRVQGSSLAAHFGADTLGKSLCESATWLDCDEVNERFRKLLADPFEPGTFYLFPKRSQPPAAERGRYETLSIVWQLRHTVVHNVGIITKSDAIRFRLLVKGAVEPLQVLRPTRDDLRYAKRFLDETAARSNERIGRRLAELLTLIHGENRVLFVPEEVANDVSRTFGLSLTIAGVRGVHTTV